MDLNGLDVLVGYPFVGIGVTDEACASHGTTDSDRELVAYVKDYIAAKGWQGFWEERPGNDNLAHFLATIILQHVPDDSNPEEAKFVDHLEELLRAVPERDDPERVLGAGSPRDLVTSGFPKLEAWT